MPAKDRMKTQRSTDFESKSGRKLAALMALVLLAACSGGNRDAEPNPHHGSGSGANGKYDASAEDASLASPDGGADEGGGSASSDANVDGAVFAGVLPGGPASPAAAAITNVLAPPANDADIVDNVIMSRLDVWLQLDATVGQVNAAVAASAAACSR